MSAAEIARAFAQNNRDHDKFVTKELHDEVVSGLREDISEIKDSLRTATRVGAGALVTVVIQLIFTLISNLPAS